MLFSLNIYGESLDYFEKKSENDSSNLIELLGLSLKHCMVL